MLRARSPVGHQAEPHAHISAIFSSKAALLVGLMAAISVAWAVIDQGERDCEGSSVFFQACQQIRHHGPGPGAAAATPGFRPSGHVPRRPNWHARSISCLATISFGHANAAAIHQGCVGAAWRIASIAGLCIADHRPYRVHGHPFALAIKFPQRAAATRPACGAGSFEQRRRARRRRPDFET